MNPRIQQIKRAIRRTGVLAPLDKLRYYILLAKLSQRNGAFQARYPDFVVPPKLLAYDAYSAPDWDYYKKSGEETAAFLADIARKYTPAHRSLHLRILEWGCGPARVLRHLKNQLEGSAQVYGSDYNPASVAWCKEHFQNVTFIENGLRPPLKLPDTSFDLVYSISVFTHLSEEVGLAWAAELLRVTRPGGVLVISTQGETFIQFMLPQEVAKYRERGIVVRGDAVEGKRDYTAFHSPNYVSTKLFHGVELVKHVGAGFPHTAQDLWILRKLG